MCILGFIFSSGKIGPTKNGVSQQSTSLACAAVWKTRPADFGTAANEIAGIILRQYPDGLGKDEVVVT